jgi:phage FluMu protein Com
MKVTMVLYHQLFPVYELTPIRCVKCSRMLCKVRGEVISLTNSIGISYENLDPSIVYIEKVCHSCKTSYKILFQ